jgi:hypothetical protein
MMNRAVMRYRANCSVQAWSAIGVVLPRGSLQRFFPAPMSSPDTMTAHWRQRGPSAASHTLITSGRFRSSSKIEPARIPIDIATPDGLVQPLFRPPSRRPPLACSPSTSRRDAGLKMLCIMLQSWGGQGTIHPPGSHLAYLTAKRSLGQG